LKESTRRIWKAWLPAIIWLCIIRIESTNYLSADTTGRWLYPFFHFLLGLDPARFAVWHHYIRKTGHFVGYFTLSFLLFRAWRATLPIGSSAAWCARWGTIAFLMTVLVASLDEWHQTFLPSRTGTVRDVILDSSAALVAQIVIFMWLRGKVRLSSERVVVSSG
jgi:VanZ family protein